MHHDLPYQFRVIAWEAVTFTSKQCPKHRLLNCRSSKLIISQLLRCKCDSQLLHLHIEAAEYWYFLLLGHLFHWIQLHIAHTKVGGPIVKSGKDCSAHCGDLFGPLSIN